MLQHFPPDYGVYKGFIFDMKLWESKQAYSVQVFETVCEKIKRLKVFFNDA